MTITNEPAPKELSAKANMAWNAVGSIINLASQWLITILIVRLSDGFNAAGVYSLASSIYAIFAPLGQYRMKVYQVSDVKGELAGRISGIQDVHIKCRTCALHSIFRFHM